MFDLPQINNYCLAVYKENADNLDDLIDKHIFRKIKKRTCHLPGVKDGFIILKARKWECLELFKFKQRLRSRGYRKISLSLPPDHWL